MLETVRDKLREIYDNLQGKHNIILEQFINQFGEQYVDTTLHTFDELVNWFNDLSYAKVIHSPAAENEYGSYKLDKDNYERNLNTHIADYCPNLRIISFLSLDIKHFLGLDSVHDIIVHFPKVTVTNEFNRSIKIQDLYAKVSIAPRARLYSTFKLARTTIPYEQFRVGYAHSHISAISSTNAGQWQTPCVGSGPIDATMNSLRFKPFNAQLWGLFTYELAKYVTIESVTGHPYVRLESVRKGNLDETMSNLDVLSDRSFAPTEEYMIKKFIKYHADKGRLKIKYTNGQYSLGENINTTIINLSNSFIEFINQNTLTIAPSLKACINNNILAQYIITNNRIYKVTSNNRSISSAIIVSGRKLFKFKGNDVKLNIITGDNTVKNSSLLLTKRYCEKIITYILNLINYKYSRTSQNGNSQRQIETSEKPYIF